MTSLRGRLLLITCALLAAGLLLSGSIVVGLLRSGLVERVDTQLRVFGGIIAAIPPGFASQAPADRVAGNTLSTNLDLINRLYIAELPPDGDPVSEVRLPPGPGGPELPAHPSDAPGPAHLAPTAPEPIAPERGAGAQRTGSELQPFEARDSAGGADWRVLVVPRDRAGTSVVVAASLDAVQATVGRLRVIYVVTGIGLLGLLTLAGWFAVGAGLRPLRDIEETAAAIAAGELGRRVPDAAPDTEVGRLSAALNGMLGQIEHAFAARTESEARLRRFVADVGHELRTPLVGIKGFSELYRMGGLPEVAPAMARIESEAGRLARLVEDLLLLARLDEGGDALPLDLAPMDLRTLAADARLDLRALAPGRPVELTGPDGGPPASAPVVGDEARLRQVVTNLVGNVVEHTPDGTPVRIGVGTRDGEAVLVIEDHGPGLGPEEAARVFDRFSRADASRSRSGPGGAGLGLAIARSLAEAHGGRLDLRTAPGRGAAFTLALPGEFGGQVSLSGR
ncbi:HAMP domain-containing sensor histidine kinase [Herbidospora sp. NBRC 101105]|uniref:sensor histidine kinase n=1 Tax=Herbidospora sp. NBRC 101105 TaxID=3032195 RepID=UPI0024A00E7F|nr:HAMP domain-containing sensor histidine kinase [Herbidospora sp. NBRC 101105]GLX93160.1 two-component sensor histidine kinase [Herbidospora sp. NBRC 101105]